MEISNETMMKCFDEIEKNHRRHELHRYQRLLENNAHSLGRDLNDKEILDFKVRFEDELAVTAFTRAGK
jgi:hypothetical protein